MVVCTPVLADADGFPAQSRTLAERRAFWGFHVVPGKEPGGLVATLAPRL